MTKQQIMAAIVKCEEKLGRSPSFIELAKMTGVTRKQVRWHFGDYRKALKACGLEGSHGGAGSKLEMEKLFRDWARVVRELKRVPTTPEYVKHGKYSQTPLMMRFGVWANVPLGMKAFVRQQGWTKEWKDVLEIIDRHQGSRRKNAWPPPGMQSPDLRAGLENAERPRRRAQKKLGKVGKKHGAGPNDIEKSSRGRELYGRLLRPGTMVCAPTNEQGVLVLFGAMLEKLGFAVLKVGTAYPDCEAFRVTEDGRLERVKIEFELESRNFLRHMHDLKKADMIVCWKHNWKECPLEVVELSKYF